MIDSGVDTEDTRSVRVDDPYPNWLEYHHSILEPKRTVLLTANDESMLIPHVNFVISINQEQRRLEVDDGTKLRSAYNVRYPAKPLNFALTDADDDDDDDNFPAHPPLPPGPSMRNGSKDVEV